MSWTSILRGWIWRGTGIALAVAALYFLNPPVRGSVEPSYGSAAFVFLLVLVSLIAGLVSAVVVCMRLFAIATLPRLYRRSLYVFIAGNCALLLNGWWAEALKYRADVYLLFGVPLLITAGISLFGPILVRAFGRRAGPRA